MTSVPSAFMALMLPDSASNWPWAEFHSATSSGLPRWCRFCRRVVMRALDPDSWTPRRRSGIAQVGETRGIGGQLLLQAGNLGAQGLDGLADGGAGVGTGINGDRGDAVATGAAPGTAALATGGAAAPASRRGGGFGHIGVVGAEHAVDVGTGGQTETGAHGKGQVQALYEPPSRWNSPSLCSPLPGAPPDEEIRRQNPTPSRTGGRTLDQVLTTGAAGDKEHNAALGGFLSFPPILGGKPGGGLAPVSDRVG